ATGVFLGKARYCSPEQFSTGGDAPIEVDRRGDIYSFGIMLYELLTGVYPLHGDNFAELAGSHLFQPPKAFSETDPEERLPDGLREAVLRSVAKSPEDRFATAADFAGALESYRDPESALRDEFDRTVEIATTAMPKVADRKRPGSTQDRLNLEFGMETTAAPGGESGGARADDAGTIVVSPGRTLATYVEEIEGLVARGRRGRAHRVLDRALADHGSAEPLIELRQAIDQMKQADGVGSKLPLAALAGAAALVIAGALGAWWWLGRTPAAEVGGTEATADPELLVTATPRWDPAAILAEPGPFDDAFTEPPALASAEAAGLSGAQPAGAPPPGPQGQPGAGPESAPPFEGVPVPFPGEPVEPAPTTPEVSREIFELGVGVVAPVLIELPPPVVPEGGRKLREQLTVVVRVLVDENGGVSRALIASGPSFRRKYRDAALAAALKARFRPARRGNTVGRMWTEVRVTFQPE
ncbi:MAG: TonB family protein, partial [Thermoanaerobaculia bacterium]